MPTKRKGIICKKYALILRFNVRQQYYQNNRNALSNAQLCDAFSNSCLV